MTTYEDIGVGRTYTEPVCTPNGAVGIVFLKKRVCTTNSQYTIAAHWKSSIDP